MYDFIFIIQGSHSIVKKCRRKTDGSIFAVKIYRNPDILEQAKNEFEILKHLKNHNSIL